MRSVSIPANAYKRTAGIDALVVRGLGRAGDVRRSDAFWQIPGQLVLAAIRHRQIDGRERAFLGSGVGDGFLFLGDPEQLLSAERDDPIEQEAGVGDHELARHTVGLPAIAEPVDELDALVDRSAPGGELGGPAQPRPGPPRRAGRPNRVNTLPTSVQTTAILTERVRTDPPL